MTATPDPQPYPPLTPSSPPPGQGPGQAPFPAYQQPASPAPGYGQPPAAPGYGTPKSPALDPWLLILWIAGGGGILLAVIFSAVNSAVGYAAFVADLATTFRLIGALALVGAAMVQALRHKQP